MKLVNKRLGNGAGFYTRDIEIAVNDVCGCNTGSFFKQFVYTGSSINFNTYLQLAGLQAQLTYNEANDDSGRKAPDLRVYVWRPFDDTVFRIGITNPQNCWGKAGLHTGDKITAINNTPVTSREGFYTVLASLHPGDTIVVTIKHQAGTRLIPVIITGYYKPKVNIVKLANITRKQQEIYNKWAAGER
jgi:predicted metalloprotease with PDZ domain